MIERDGRGRFPKGTTGNRRGRPRKTPARLDTVEDLDDVIIEVMNMPTKVRIGAEEETVTIYKANVLRLATGNVQNRLAAMDAISMMRRAVWGREDRYRRRAQIEGLDRGDSFE